MPISRFPSPPHCHQCRYPRTALVLGVLFVTLITGGCSDARYQKVRHVYMAPPEHPVVKEDATIAFTFSGRGLDRTFEQYRPELKTLRWTSSSQTSDYVIDIAALDPVYDYQSEQVQAQEYTVIFGANAGQTYLKYHGRGKGVAGYRIEIYDRNSNGYLLKKEGQIVKWYNAKEQRSASGCSNVIRNKFNADRRALVMGAGNQAKREATATLRRFFEEHPVSEHLPVASEHKTEPRIAEAYAILRTKTNSAGAQEAIIVYQAIGTENKTDKGELNDDLNAAVHQGLATCYGILRNEAKRRHHQVRADALR